MKKQPFILVVDDEPAILKLVKEILLPTGYLVSTAGNGKEALAALQAHPYDLVLTDMIMPQMGGMELVQYLQLHHPETLVIVFTGFASYQDAVDAVKLGAFDYLPKPLQPEILHHAIERALEYQRLCRSQRDLETVFQGAESLGWQAMELVSDTAEAAILGELRERAWQQTDLKEVGQIFLEAAQQLLHVTNSSIFFYDAVRGQFTGLAALGPDSEAKTGAMITAEGVMGYVATHRRPLLVPDLSRNSSLSFMPRRTSYQTNSFMVIPLTGYKFWGVINLADRADHKPFGARDLFLGWLMGRLLVEILESREAPEEFDVPSLTNWINKEIPVGLALVDKDLGVVQSNPALERMVGLARDDLSGKNLLSCLGLNPADRSRLEQAFPQVLASQEPQEFYSLTSTYQKMIRYLGVKFYPMPNGSDSMQGLILVEDVTEAEQLKQRLELYEHLAIMGKLTLCVAHELNNPLDGIRRYLSLAMMKKEDSTSVERYLTEAQKGLQKMSISLKSLMFSANPFKGPPRANDTLLNLLQDAIKIMMFQASDQRVQIDFHYPPEFEKIVTEADLYYVFINIIKNALQAMPQGGRLEVNGFLNGTQMEVCFHDSGQGLTSQEMDHIFQPFYSTKTNTQGLGLGLPICQKILERYNGSLKVESRPGEGTKVRVLLPYTASGVLHGQ
jgi:two-component system, NtrC family, nitrogen regulation sensor histidine kinase GlnL